MPLVQAPGLPPVNIARTGPRGRAPVLMLHGVGLDLTWWDAQFAALCDDHDLAALDMPGHGLSPALDGRPSFDLLARIAAAVIEHLDAGPAHLVGVSVGGMIAQTLALMRPDLVRSLTLVATLCTFPDPVRTILRDRARTAREHGMATLAPITQERWFSPAFRTRRPDVLDRAAKSLLAHDPAVHGAMWDMIAELDLRDRLPALRCPALVIAGTKDGNAPPEAGRLIADLIPGATFHALEDIGHFPPVEAPDRFNALLRPFLDQPPHPGPVLPSDAGQHSHGA